MAEEAMYASAGTGAGHVTPRRRKSDEDSTTGDSLAEFRAGLIREISKRDREVGNLLSEKLDTHHAVIIGRLDGIQTTQEAHAAWIRARDTLQAEEDRQRAEQQLRASILSDLEEAGKAKYKARRDRWSRTVSLGMGALVTGFFGLLFYALETLDQLHWDRHGQFLLAGTVVVGIAIVLLARFGP